MSITNQLLNCTLQDTFVASGITPPLRTLEDRSGDRPTVEDFGARGTGAPADDDTKAIQAALDWSAANCQAIYASRAYWLSAKLTAKSDTRLIASPAARFIRGFGSNEGKLGDYMVQSADGSKNVSIEGGIWGFRYAKDDSYRPRTWSSVSVSIQPDSSNTSLLSLSGLTSASFNGYTQALWLYGGSDAKLNRVFSFANQSGVPSGKIRVNGVFTGGGTSYTVAVLPLAGGGFKINSDRGVIRGVTLVNTRGIGFFLSGDDFEISDACAYEAAFDGGGGIRFQNGARFRASNCHMESSDDCFQLNVGVSGSITGGSFVDGTGLTNQGALLSFINGGDPESPSGGGTMTGCYAQNIRGSTGGSLVHGGSGIKILSIVGPISDLWMENVHLQQSTTVSSKDAFSAIKVVTSGSGTGLANCGIRDLVVVDRTGPLLLIQPADSAPNPASDKIDLTIINARAIGAGSSPGSPLIAAPYAARLELRNISGDLSESDQDNPPGRAFQIGTTVSYSVGGVGFSVTGGHVGELIIDGFSTSNAAPIGTSPNLGAVWQIGDVGKGSIRRLSTTLAGSSQVGGLEMVTTGTGARFCDFYQTDFTNVSNGRELVSWIPSQGNTIRQSISFDDQSETISVLGTASSLSVQRHAPTVFLTLGAGGTPNLTTMTQPGVKISPRCTLVVPAGINITAANPVPPHGFALGPAGTLNGSNTANITFQWREIGNKWFEVARSN